jgi:tRNA threonylcarbamoyladenosine biosynthesis protein TsaB
VRVLAFDTATPATTTAIHDDAKGLLEELRDDPPPGRRPNHARLLTAQIVGLMRSTGTRWEDLDRIAVGIGPGTFTGLRIGIATARALGAARRLPVVGILTLESLACGAALQAGGAPVLAAIDARRNEAFVAAWRADARGLGECLVAPRTAGADELERLVGDLGGAPLAVGSGAVEFSEILKRAGAAVPAAHSERHRVTATNHCLLALAAPPGRYGDIHPLYLRLADAEIARRQREAGDPAS